MTNEIDSIEGEIAKAEARLTALDENRDRLSRHIERLKDRLRSVAKAQPPGPATQQASLTAAPVPSNRSEKIALFMSLFRGRTDVYPKGWVSKTKGTRGYSPACSNEWNQHLCDKRSVKCGECPNQAFIPVTKESIRAHFEGHHLMGVYPMLPDETCWFLALDFDKGQWQDDVAGFIATCGSKGIPCAVERSRSGNGAHVWFFFAAPVAASTARKTGCFLITETMGRRHELPMTSYDRLFPSQDTIPRGGFGNLIALPFHGDARQKGNSVFVDETWTPFPDQWAFLAGLRRIHPTEVAALAQEAAKRGEVIGVRMGEPADDGDPATPWMRSPSRRVSRPTITEPLPHRIAAVFSQLLFVETAGLPSPLINQIKRLAAFQNPDFYKRQAMRLSTALTPRVISCAEDHPGHVGLPRGCVNDVEGLLAELKVGLSIEDKRTDGCELDVNFHGELTPTQQDAADAMIPHEIGVFVAPPGSGKTVVGANLIARRKRSTLVLVHRTQLLEQWIAQLALFLNLNPKEIGQIGGGKRKPNGSLDVAMIQSLVSKDQVNNAVSTYGHVLVDECHHVPAVSFERIMRAVQARYIAGLTATPQRRDGHHPILKLQLGPIRFAIDAKSQAAARGIEHKLIIRETEFCLASDIADAGIQDIYRLLAQDEGRNRLILDDVVQALEEKRSPILLTERRDHLEYFAERLRGLARNLIILHGGMKTSDRRAAVEQLTKIPETEERLVLATGRFIGEGFDDARLDTLFLALPVSWKGTLVQYAGRLHRQHHAKTEVRVMDYVDGSVPTLAKMYARRMSGYRAMGYAVGEHLALQSAEEDYVLEYDPAVLHELENEGF